MRYCIHVCGLWLFHITDDWRCDQYRWINQGVHNLPKRDPTVQKSYFQISTPHGPSQDFVRHSYELIPSNHFTLIQYLGDDSTASNFPHGNTKNHTRHHVRTCPSVLKELENRCALSSTSKVYKACITKLPPVSHIPVLQPRNSTQVENVRRKILRRQRISHDALYNLHELAVDMPSFIHSIKTYPDMVCICGEKSMLNELDRVLLLDSPSCQLLSYDTTFQLGDFYISVLSFRHTLFTKSPVMPAAFLIHERKLHTYHKEFFDVCTKLSTSLKNTTFPIVTDEEKAFVSAIAAILPKAPHLRCWNHILRDIRRWLHGHGATSTDTSVYIMDVLNLFHQPKQEAYKEKLEEMTAKWSSPFYEYYMDQIEPDISSVARWAIEPMGVYNPYSGVTNNQAEGLNYLLKQLQQWHEAPVDCMLLSMQHLQSYYLTEIARGQNGMGNYHLHPQFSQITNTIPLPTSPLCSPEEIVQRIKGELIKPAPSPDSTSSVNAAQPLIQSRSSAQLSQRDRAIRVIEENRISMDVKLHTFTILGSERPYVVTLFPKETCSCPSTSPCYHILAARLSVGLDNHQASPMRKLNLTQLRRNARSTGKKKSGRKRPRPGDCDITPAPDSKQAAADRHNSNGTFAG